MSQIPPNLFDHHHGHDHDHDHGDQMEVDQTLDPAQQSMADALRICFFLLWVAMVIVLILYAGSGYFTVPQQQQALLLRFGEIIGEGPERVLNPGVHFSWPYPINQVVFVTTSSQRIEVDHEFWIDLGEGDKGKSMDELATARGGNSPLNPEKDGSVITGDFNIIHVRGALSYHVADSVKYAQSINDAGLAEQLVRAATARSIVATYAGFTADQAIKGDWAINAGILKRIQASMDEMNSGIVIEPSALAFSGEMPIAVRNEYRAVIDAENERATAIEKAEKERNKILQETAGDAYPWLITLIRQYAADVALGKPEDIQAREAQISTVFSTLEITGTPAAADTMPSASTQPVEAPVAKTFRIEGEVAGMINDAKSYQTTVRVNLQTELNRFNSYESQFEGNPGLRQIVMGRLWQETKEEILGGDVETFYLPKGQTYIDISRDPMVSKRRQENLAKQEQLQRFQSAKEVYSQRPPGGGTGANVPRPPSPPPAPPSH